MGPVPIAKVAIKVNETDSRNGPWYVESFKHDYLKIYAHRTDEAAQREVNLIIDLLICNQGARFLIYAAATAAIPGPWLRKDLK